uniref:Serine/threonine protein kinase n=1 Tax=Solibacter usitatus (strain Ellin6076) TaxID=234267 RepID=Q01ZV5_SOLUE
MNRDRENFEALFAYAADLPPGDRGRYLDELSGSDPALAGELASLLDFDPSAGPRLRGIVDRVVADASLPALWSGQLFGSYRLVRTIGAGGMGTVFEAVREQDYHKRVALKVAASAIGTPAWVERFKQERQILSGLDHPNIARFLDGGASSDGLPYFAMELVEGEPITDFVIDRNCGLRERIELFRKVCAAVSFAHQSLVVHRDLKPGNILVTAGGEPKLLDFGLAKLQSPIDPCEGFTRTALPFLTPAYCSPEQVLGEKITTRVDVYLLGLILFELLTGSQAHQLTGSSPAELQQIVSEEHTPVPSARATQAGNLALAKSLRGDLDKIVLKAIQKDPARRYQSVDEFNLDLGRYLDGRPVLARSAGWSYRATKFLRRNWISAGVAAAAILAVIGGALAFARQARIAEERFDLARRLSNVLLFDIHDRVQAMPGAVDLREMISSTAVQYLDALSRQAGRNYPLRRELAAGYLRLSSAEWFKGGSVPSRASGDPLSALNRALALLEGMPASELALAAATEGDLRLKRGEVLQQSSRLDAAIADFERAAAVSQCSPQTPALCRNRISALGHLVMSYATRQDLQACRSRLVEMRRDMETYRSPGGELFYQQSALRAGMAESKVAAVQKKHADAARIMLDLLPAADLVGSQPHLEPQLLRLLSVYYRFLAWRLRQAGQSTPRARIQLIRKGLEFGQRYLELDPEDVIAQFAVVPIFSDMAEEYESVDQRQAAHFYEMAVQPLLKRPDQLANMDPRIELYDNGCSALRFFLRIHRQDEAVSLARRISGAMSPVMFLGLNLPRSQEVQAIQALWWTASEAVQEKSGSAESLWKQAVRAAQEGLQRTPQDPVMQASAALAFEGLAVWLHSSGSEEQSEPHLRAARALWSRLSEVYPTNSFIRNHALGAGFDHQHD